MMRVRKKLENGFKRRNVEETLHPKHSETQTRREEIQSEQHQDRKNQESFIHQTGKTNQDNKRISSCGR